MNPETIGCVWTGEFDLNTLRAEGEIFKSGKKKLRIQKYPDTCGWDLRENERSGTDTEMLICSLINYPLHSQHVVHAGSTAFLYANYLKVSFQNSMKLILFSVYKALNQ